MEIIEEQKQWFEQQKRLEQARGSTGGKGKVLVYKERRPLVRQTTATDQTRRGSTDSTSISETELAEAQDRVPEIVIMHTRDSSKDTVDTATTTGTSGRKVSLQGHKRQSRRFSAFDEFRRKARTGIFGGPSSQTRPERQKRWKAGSMALSNFGSKEGK